jgi:peptide/nickel transport system substrate-binding protein
VVKPLLVSMKAWAVMAMALVMALAVACSSSPAPAAPGVTPAELQAALNAAVQAAPSGPSAAEISSMVASAVEGAVPEGTDPAEISSLVQAAVSAATAKAAGSAVTPGDIRAAISAAAAASSGPDPLSSSEVSAIVAAAVAAIPTPAPAMAPVASTSNATPDYWNPPSAFYGQPLYGGEMIVNFEDPLEHANTWGAYTATVTRYRSPIMNSLIGEDPYSPGKIVPDLASSWEQDSDGQGLTFKFVEGINWHDGQAFVCEDANYTIDTMINGEADGRITASEMGAKLAFIESSSCNDDTRLHVRYSGGTDTALVAFIDRGFLVFQKDWFLEGGEDAMFQDVSVGTGPFIWEEGQNVGVDVQHFEANPDYFKPGLPYLDRLTIHGILDESVQQATMLAHQTNWHWVRNFGQYDAYVDNDQIQTVIRATRGHHGISLNSGKAPFDNVKVRQAIMMGMDRGAAIAVLQAGHGSTGFIMPPGGAWDLTQAQGCAVPGWCVPAAGYDAQRLEAIAILEGEGFDFDATYTITVESDEQVQTRATLIQEQLRLLGITMDFDSVESVAWRQQVTTGGWGHITPSNSTMPADNPGLGMSFYYGCASSTNYITPQTACNETSEALLATLASASDPKAQKIASDELQLYLMGQYLRFPLYWEQEAAAFWPEVRGYVHQPQPSGPFMRWEQTWIDPSHADDSGFKGQITGVPGGI